MRRTHAVLIALTGIGTVVIAGIGFAGSYAAVRELALQKGFGNFAHVFPIGIDAGICVLLALDLLLTWIRIPFPLLRQTAWLLTAATIAFNGAAAWPDPLGVGMHSVIPILFVVSVEAARHAVGRIADITADKHMEGVRLTRWILSPVPTFLLWRRMKLWELRSYEQVIKLEQERLVYQARLRSRFGRAWRRKAPVESLMPLRLARYGIPLAETAPAGLAAAGIQPIPPHPAHPQSPPASPAPAPQPAPVPAAATNERATTRPHPHTVGHTAPARTAPTTPPPRTDTPASTDPADHTPRSNDTTSPHNQAPASAALSRSRPHPPEAREKYRSGMSAGQSFATNPKPRHQRGEVRKSPAGEDETHQHEKTKTPLPDNGEATPASSRPDLQPSGHTPDEHPQHRRRADRTQGKNSQLTSADRYYLAWHAFLQHHEREPTPQELSTALATNNVLDTTRQPVKPKTLARYYLQFRIYTAWARYRTTTENPDLNTLTEQLTRKGITAQYNKPLHPTHIHKYLPHFQRRYSTLQRQSGLHQA
ncbi:DUF2637 domain-containing protein [Streptomyces scabiei]|uniref:DUF2637 domain-containing protein n=1 Tax=Streptomyces scabiei TaxID=1930 RepID=A0A100JTK6_STRSC|nr:DUF2637 domain-containing protein [Streptomyces scabiei]GAQ65412.1 hypothetical protein SsS58_05821 [Streptomyces scabiei]